MLLDLTTVSFSRRESTMAISWRGPGTNVEEGLYLRAIHGAPKWGNIFRISLWRDGKELSFRTRATPTQLTLLANNGRADFIFAEPDSIRFRTRGVVLRLEMKTVEFDNAQPLQEKIWMVTNFEASTKFLLSAIKGSLEVDAPWGQLKCTRVEADFIPEEGDQSEGEIREFADHAPKSQTPPSFADGLENVHADWLAWRDANRGKSFQKATDLAAYVNWSALVPARGALKRPAMLMSKNVMSNIWSWDHCFNAMAHIESHPSMAWDQFMIFFDHQSPSGAIPDRMGDHVIVWDFAKPPVHGWALSWMLAKGWKPARTQLISAYRALASLANWWTNSRDFDQDGRPEYYHGNDAGWDNSTVFLNGGPVEGPDLMAFLVLQFETLANLAARLKRPAEAKLWRGRARESMTTLIRDYWRKDHFIAYGPGNEEISDCQSLLLFLPLVLGKRLPAGIRKALISRLKSQGHVTSHGLATESPHSPFYESDGYWRGPIWAPSTLLIVDGLWQMGERSLARKIAKSFCRICAKSGFAENFDALTGAGLRDRSYTWTASVFLILSRHYAA